MENSAKRLKSINGKYNPRIEETAKFEINPLYSSSKSVHDYNEWLNSNKTDSYVTDDFILVKEPFSAFQFRNFCSDDDVLESLKDEVDNFEYRAHETDLFCFKKTDELNSVKDGIFGAFREFVYNDVKNWVEDMCGIKFNDKVDLFAAKYSHGDVLLCHDDQVSTRKIAFILYLSKNWKDEDGGKLDLIDSDNFGNPTHVATSLDIGFNVFNFFIVCPKSFHQVAEVLTDKTRLSISGWFHTDDSLPSDNRLCDFSSAHCTFDASKDLSLYLNPSFLTEIARAQLAQNFEETSYILMTSFFTTQAYTNLRDFLVGLGDTAWRREGPMDVRNMDLLEGEHEIMDVFKSRMMTKFLRDISQLEIWDEGFFEVWRLGRGMYTLLHSKEEVLDDSDTICFYFTVCNTNFDSNQCGGYVVFVDTQGGDELVRIPNNEGNTVGVVYANAGTSSFLKYINCNFGDDYFYVVKIVYPIIDEGSSD